MSVCGAEVVGAQQTVAGSLVRKDADESGLGEQPLHARSFVRMDRSARSSAASRKLRRQTAGERCSRAFFGWQAAFDGAASRSCSFSAFFKAALVQLEALSKLGTMRNESLCFAKSQRASSLTTATRRVCELSRAFPRLSTRAVRQSRRASRSSAGRRARAPGMSSRRSLFAGLSDGSVSVVSTQHERECVSRRRRAQRAALIFACLTRRRCESGQTLQRMVVCFLSR